MDEANADGLKDAQLKREEEELSKIATGIGKVFLKNVKEREKIKQWKAAHLDPRNASRYLHFKLSLVQSNVIRFFRIRRTPSANKEPHYKLRFESPVGASPSRNADHPKPFEEEEFERSISCRSSVGRSVGQIPNYNGKLHILPIHRDNEYSFTVQNP